MSRMYWFDHLHILIKYSTIFFSLSDAHFLLLLFLIYQIILLCAHYMSNIITYYFTSYRIISYHIISYPILSYPIISYPIISYHILSYHIISQHLHMKSSVFSSEYHLLFYNNYVSSNTLWKSRKHSSLILSLVSSARKRKWVNWKSLKFH